jgi:hypothetical protein
MNLTQELERLAKLHAEGALTDAEFAQAKKQLLVSRQGSRFLGNGIRRQSATQIGGLPLWSVALGPDWERGEMRGHARGIFAVGDMATGIFACGGVARGIFAFGGLAIGIVAVGGGAIGVLLAIGGGAVGGIAFGGGAIGGVAVGGGAFGYYACGGGAGGVHTISAAQQDPAAVEFFQHYFPWVNILFRR